MEEVGPDTEVEKMTVSIASNEGHTHTLVDGVYGTQLSCDNNNNYTISISDLTDANGVVHPDNAALGAGTDMVDNDLYGSIQSIREILTEKGEFSSQNDVDNVDPDALVKRGIPYYQKALDSLAYEFATAMNELNHVYDSSGKLVAGAGNLFSIGSNTNDAVATDPVTGAKTQITASNISVSYGWANQTVSIQAASSPDAPSGDTSRLAEFLDLFSKKLDFVPSHVDGDAIGDAYHGTFEDMLLKIQSTLAEDQMSTDAVLNNYTITADNIYTDRDGVSGVDLNDEATGLMTYQKAYTAACRLMNVLNEALDSLINGTV